MADILGGAISGGLQTGLSTGNPYAAIGGAVLGAIGGGFSGDAKAAARRAQRASRRIEQLNAMREQVATQRAANAQRAEVVQASASDGSLATSGVQGALSGLGSQLNGAFGYANAVNYQRGIIRKATRDAQYGQDRAGIVSSLAQAGNYYAILKSNQALRSGLGTASVGSQPASLPGIGGLSPAPSIYTNDGQAAAPSFFGQQPSGPSFFSNALDSL